MSPSYDRPVYGRLVKLRTGTRGLLLRHVITGTRHHRLYGSRPELPGDGVHIPTVSSFSPKTFTRREPLKGLFTLSGVPSVRDPVHEPLSTISSATLSPRFL